MRLRPAAGKQLVAELALKNRVLDKACLAWTRCLTNDTCAVFSAVVRRSQGETIENILLDLPQTF